MHTALRAFLVICAEYGQYYQNNHKRVSGCRDSRDIMNRDHMRATTGRPYGYDAKMQNIRRCPDKTSEASSNVSKGLWREHGHRRCLTTVVAVSGHVAIRHRRYQTAVAAVIGHVRCHIR